MSLSPRARFGLAVLGSAAPLALLTAPAAQAETAPAVHTVKPGETPWGIAEATGTPLDRLLRLNGLQLSSTIHVGQRLLLDGPSASAPRTGTVEVRRGEGWWQLAERTGVPAATLQSLNAMSPSTVLHPGMVLTTASGAASPAPSAATTPAVTAAPTAETVEVRRGEGWWQLAERTGVPAATLQSLNAMGPSTELHPGMVLTTASGAATIPARTASAAAVTPAPVTTTAPQTGAVIRHTVAHGDSMWSISQRHQVSIPHLRELNGLTRASMLHPGQVLVVSDGTPEPLAGPVEGPIGDTFLTRTYPTYVTAAANANLRALQTTAQPTPEQMQQIVRQAALDLGVDPRLALGHAYTESRFRHASVSPGNAIGVMQVMPVSGEFASDLVGRELDLLDPYDNATAGVALIRYLQASTSTTDLGIGAYYQGLGGVLDDGPWPDTLDYIAKVKAARAMF